MSAADNIGAHLLGRKAPAPDERDWKLEAFLAGGDDLDAALAALVASKSAAGVTKTLAKALTAHVRKLEGAPAPAPAPPPPPGGAVLWGDPDQLDQGQTGHCVGFGCAQFCNADPIEDHLKNADGDAIYYEAKVIDGEPKAEDGSSVHSGIKALVNRKRIGAYAWASTLDVITQWVATKGPVVVGSDWYNGMFTPNNGFVQPTGGIAGGHCFICVGYNPATKDLTFQNSWGASWGKGGRFLMQSTDFDVLVKANGFEACAAVELAL